MDGDRDAVPHFPYGRPSVSAWVAAASVAFAVFLLGGFIKTYKQLEQLQEESRNEIAELRDSIRRLQVQQAVNQSPSRSRLPSLASAASAQPQPDPRAQYRPERPSTAIDPAPIALPTYEEPEQRGIRYQWGRTSGAQPSRTLATASGGPSQVVSVSGANKRVMIEGGRDVGLAEGARLELCRDSRWIADLRVQDVFGNQSSCEVLHATQPPQPGDTVRMPEKGM